MGALETIKDLWRLAQIAGNTELAAKATQAMADAFELAERNASVQQELFAAQTKIRELEAAANLAKRIRPDDRNRLYFVRRESGDGADGPYCVKCFDATGKLMRMWLEVTTKATVPGKAHSHHWKCHQCKSVGVTLE